MDQNLKSNFPLYWKVFLSLIFTLIVLNIIFHEYIAIISFTNLFGFLIPNWIITFVFNRIEVKRIKNEFTSYLEANYNEKLKIFYDTYENHSNPNTKPVFILFSDKELLKDPVINFLKNESNKVIMLLVCVSAITILLFLISTVFIMKNYYK